MDDWTWVCVYTHGAGPWRSNQDENQRGDRQICKNFLKAAAALQANLSEDAWFINLPAPMIVADFIDQYLPPPHHLSFWRIEKR